MDQKTLPFFVVKVEFETESENGKPKKIKEQYLVDAMTCTEAEARMVEYLDGTLLDYKIVSVTQSQIVAVVEKKS